MPTKLPDLHAYWPNGIPTHRGGPHGCAHCPLPKGHAVHEVPPNPVAEDEARLLGDHPVEDCPPAAQPESEINK
jgi:hypothetical protein